jgi:RimJ/RimL family protein N-acetyltransferase
MRASWKLHSLWLSMPQEAMELLLKEALTALRVHRLEANTQPGNLSSIALAERCGFRTRASRRGT